MPNCRRTKGAAFERLHGRHPLGLRPLGGDVDARVAQVVGHAHVRHRHRIEPRVFQLVTDDLDDLLADQFCKLLRPTHKNRES